LSAGVIFPIQYYQRSVQLVARDLLGKKLIRLLNGIRVGGMICEVEAYDGEEDQACHARSGRTTRNSVMYGTPGRAYVYFTYGMHWMLNAVCREENYPAAVLIRAIMPLEGLDVMAQNRAGIPTKNWCSGPARLTRALDIKKDCNNTDLTNPQSGLFIEDFRTFSDLQIQSSPRIGIQYAGEPWLSLPWRFLVSEDTCKTPDGDL
jgi:DNA-3-methyladenine glycosylase